MDRSYFFAGHSLLLVIIGQFYVIGVAVVRSKSNPPLIVHTNAVLPRTVAFQFFQAIARRRAEIVERLCRVEHQELSQGRTPHGGRHSFDRLSAKEPRRLVIAKTAD